MNKTIIKNFIYNSSYQLLSILIPIVTTPYLARVLGSKGMGVYSYSSAVAYYFVIFIMLGLNNYGNRTIATCRNNIKNLSQTFCEIYSMQLFLGIIINVGYLVCYIIFWNDDKYQLLMWIYVVSATIDINWFFFGIEEFKYITLRNIIIKLGNTVLIFALVKNKDDLLVYFIIMLCSFFIGNAILWPRLFRIIKISKVNLYTIKKHIKPNFILFIPVIAISIYTYISKIILGYYSSMTEVGYYEYSQRIMQIPLALVVSLGTIMLPRMSKIQIDKNGDLYESYISKSMIFVLFISTSICFGIMGVSKEFVPIFFGRGYQKCVSLLLILLPSCVFMSFANVIRTQYLIPQKMDSIYIKSVFLGACINVLVNFMFIPKIHSVGASIGTLCAEITVCVYQTYKISNLLPIRKYIFNSLPFISAGIGMFGMLYYIVFPVKNIVICLILKISFGAIIYLIFLCLFLYNRWSKVSELLSFSKIKKVFRKE